MHTHIWCFYSQTKQVTSILSSEVRQWSYKENLWEKQKSSKSWYFSLVKITLFEICVLFYQYIPDLYFINLYIIKRFIHSVHRLTKASNGDALLILTGMQFEKAH